jgi:signal transduction histidine kinase/ActR/RegA family two-component response regulator
VAVATGAHRDEIARRLRQRGFDVVNDGLGDRYFAFDASAVLGQISIKDSPDQTLFDRVIGGIIKSAGQHGRPLKVFGEMVDLLSARGIHAQAIRLEEMWNELAKRHPFQLFCAYSISSFPQSSSVGSLVDVCRAHARVIPTESYNALISDDERLREIIVLQQKALALESELREREQLLSGEKTARAEAEAANRMKDEFLAIVSHELRTPLNAIIGWAHMLRNRSLDQASVERALETIERNAKSQAQLIEDILDVSRVVSGKLKLNQAPVDVASVINAAIDAVQLAAESRKIQIEVTLDPAVRHIYGDRNRLQQVVWNLMSNAIKFTPSGGRVDVSLRRSNSQVQIKVKDTGQGINPAFLPYIFDRFRQADASTTRTQGGLGLGLSIARHLIELHGGTIEAQSAGANRGATFIITLPVTLAPAAESISSHDSIDQLIDQSFGRSPNASGQLRLTRSIAGRRVLLVDDDADTLKVLAAMIEDYQATVQTAACVRDALDTLNWFQPDVIVSDLAMPEEDGFSLIQKIRSAEATRQTQAIALTAFVRVEDRVRALRAGFNMFVPKPIEPNELIAAIANLTETTN